MENLIENLKFLVNITRFIIAFLGLIIICISAIRAFYNYIFQLFTKQMDVNLIRLDLGRNILVALEFIVAADILGSILSPTYYEIGILILLVLIRTFLGFFLNKEIRELSIQK